MREAYSHVAELAMPTGDSAAPGAAITLALCGGIQHLPPCPLAPHHTAAERDGETVRLRVLFAAEPGDEREVRTRIDAALISGQQEGPDGAANHWRLVSSGTAEIAAGEFAHAERLRSQ